MHASIPYVGYPANKEVDSKMFLLFGLENHHRMTLKWTYLSNYDGLKVLSFLC